MPRGGRRANSGRKAGSATKKTREIANAVASQPKTRSQILADEASLAGLTPIEYMLSVVRDPEASDQRRDAMAAQAAPFCHPRLQAVSLASHGGGGIGAGDRGGNVDIVSIYAVPRGARFEKDGSIVIDGGTVTELKPVEPFVGTPPLGLTDQSLAEPLPVVELDVSNVTRLDSVCRRDDDDPDGAA